MLLCFLIEIYIKLLFHFPQSTFTLHESEEEHCTGQINTGYLYLNSRNNLKLLLSYSETLWASSLLLKSVYLLNWSNTCSWICQIKQTCSLCRCNLGWNSYGVSWRSSHYVVIVLILHCPRFWGQSLSGQRTRALIAGGGAGRAVRTASLDSRYEVILFSNRWRYKNVV